VRTSNKDSKRKKWTGITPENWAKEVRGWEGSIPADVTVDRDERRPDVSGKKESRSWRRDYPEQGNAI